jgi:hypothetical protein
MPAGMASVVNHAAFLHHLRWRAPQQVWGDGFADLSLGTSLYPRDWSDVSDDELVLFFPHLTGRDHPEFGIAARVRAAYVRRIATSAIISADNGAAPHRYSRAEPSATDEQAIATRLGPDENRPFWATESAIIEAVGHMLCEACAAAGNTPALSEALLASIHTGINAAYIYPAHASAHELLATGAWFGTLLMGRPALMPEFVAHVCMDCLDGTRNDLVSKILLFHAARLGGTSLYLRHAQKTIKSGRTSVVRTRRA